MTVVQFERPRMRRRRVKFLPSTQYGRLKCVKVVQFERPRMRGRGVKFLPPTQYGRLKCVTVVQFERIQDPRMQSQFLTADSVWEAEMCDSCAV